MLAKLLKNFLIIELMDVIKIKNSWMGLKIALIPGGGGICEPKTGQRKDTEGNERQKGENMEEEDHKLHGENTLGFKIRVA